MSKLRIQVNRYALAWLPLLSSCLGAGADAGWTGTIEILPNGASRVTNPATGLWQHQGAWQLEQEFVLGEADGDEARVFATISGLEVDKSGNVFVLDRQANNLRIFDASGRHIRTVGRAGQGPGEYTEANGLVWFAEDTLLVIDQRGGRYTLLDRDGQYIRTVARRLSFYGWVFSGGVDGMAVHEVSSTGQEADLRPILLGTRLSPDDPSGGPQLSPDTVKLARSDGPLYESFSIRTATGGMVMSVPFSGGPQYVLDGKGGLWHGHGGTSRIYHSTFGQDTIAEIILNTQPVAVSPGEIAEWEAGSGVEQFKTRGGKLDLNRIPKVKPFFDGMVLDPEGYVWMTVPAAPGVVRFAVIDPDGRYLGELDVHSANRDEYVAPVVRSDRLYFVGRDELDVQRVYVYRIMKSRT